MTTGTKGNAEKTLKVKTTVEVPLQRVADLLVSAFEGGSGYWAVEAKALGLAANKAVRLSFGTGEDGDNYYPRIIRYPLSGGVTMVRDSDESKWHRLDMAAIERGLYLMAQKYPKHFADFVAENDDAGTADVFLQLALLGEVVYG